MPDGEGVQRDEAEFQGETSRRAPGALSRGLWPGAGEGTGFVCFSRWEGTQHHRGLTGITSWRGQRPGQSPQVHGTSGPTRQWRGSLRRKGSWG